MQPVQFPCGRCGKLMGVSSEHLGQHVRCPHCQEVVFAPPSAVTEPPPDLVEMIPPAPAPTGEAEDIFSPVDISEDLFGRSEGPRLEMPPESLPPTLPDGNAAALPQPQANMPPTLSWSPPASGSAASWMSGTVTEMLPPPPASTGETPVSPGPPAADGEPPAASARARQRTEAKAPWFLLLVFCPLLLYAIVISIFAFFLYRHDQHLQEQMLNPFENLPDVGDDPGVHKGKKVSLTDRYKSELATLPLPESLCTTLGNPFRIGDLQVTPNRVERKRISVKVENTQPEACHNDSLVLYLDLKNLSPDYAFAPLDDYFDRYWRPGVDLIPPLTQLEIGNKYRCYGGPAHWHPRSNLSYRREWIQGRHEKGDFLQPGEEKQFFVCTDGEDDRAADVLFGRQSGEQYHGSFLWRVRVRRGLTRFQDKDYSTTAVIGVRFSETDIHKSAPDAQ